MQEQTNGTEWRNQSDWSVPADGQRWSEQLHEKVFHQTSSIIPTSRTTSTDRATKTVLEIGGAYRKATPLSALSATKGATHRIRAGSSMADLRICNKETNGE